MHCSDDPVQRILHSDANSNGVQYFDDHDDQDDSAMKVVCKMIDKI